MTTAFSLAQPDIQQERHRLQKEAEFIGPCSRKFLETAGIIPGMKVLELGSGAGDLSMLLAELVGREGLVVGFESDLGLLDGARERVYLADYNNVFFMDEDSEVFELDQRFDAVVGRSALAVADQPSTTLQRAVDHLPAGGIVAFQEMDLTLLQHAVPTHPACPLYRRVIDWICAARELSGTRIHMGFQLRRTFLDAGLPEPQMHIDAPIGGGPHWGGYDYLADTVRDLLPTLEDLGIAARDEVAVHTLAERLRNEAMHYDAVAAAPAWVGAWSRKTWTC